MEFEGRKLAYQFSQLTVEIGGDAAGLIGRDPVAGAPQHDLRKIQTCV